MRRTVITIGNFDGLHRGHQRVISELKRIAKKKNLVPVVLTFLPTKYSSTLLMSGEGKKELLKKWNIKMYSLNPEDIFHLSAEEFVRDTLVKKFNPEYVVIGEKFRFGYLRRGDVSALKKLGEKYNFQVRTVPLLKNNKENISSSNIRKLLKKGKMEEVNNLLGRPYEISGRVILGDGRGSKLGFPTANLGVNSGLLLPRGVFITKVLKNGHQYQGIVNIGAQPTFSTQNYKTNIETHLFSYRGNLYQKELTLLLLKKIREEKKFFTPSDLKKQIEKDILQTKNFFQGGSEL
ncbi:MAG TPA: bifunctional riboflavin kinase/FMN adenylyltransferase [Elusimicrobia bacterium]|jgi:riboflavin kinase/FMN adenylyltransferase|nr:bifunctional riboflavin kinase/FMN adenylyltransferase [Elusimicrobiota bacterium]